MKKIILFSLFLLGGLVLSQVLPALVSAHAYEVSAHLIKLLTTVMLGFIMIHVGYEFDLDKSRLGAYGWDYVVAATAATIPWIFVAIYFVFVLSGENGVVLWQKALLTSRFASPTSAGVLFSMLGAAGLASTWMFRKIKVLAIFDDLDTVLLMIPLQMMLVGLKWQLGVVLVPMALLVFASWRYLHRIRLPITWPWVLAYSVGIALVSEAIYISSKFVDELVPIHIEVLLPAFVLGCVIARQAEHPAAPELGGDVLERPGEKLVSLIISTIFMAMVGLSMPALTDVAGPPALVERAESEMAGAYVISEGPAVEVKAPAAEVKAPERAGLSWPILAFHVLIVTIISNIGKLFPFFCYKKEAHWRDRLAVAVGMFPRGEVGAGVLIISISYKIGGPMITVAMLSLALNLFLTGVFIMAVKKLLDYGEVT
jgi:hypothetical protein